MTLRSEGMLQVKIQKVSAWDRSGSRPTLSTDLIRNALQRSSEKKRELRILLVFAGFSG